MKAPGFPVLRLGYPNGVMIARGMGKIARQRRSRQETWPATTEHVSTEDRRRTWRRHGWRLLAIWGLVLIAYSNSSQSGLVFDNFSIIGRDPRIRQATSQN